MRFQGFRSVSDYEHACSDHGFLTERIPFINKNDVDQPLFLLVTKVSTPTLSSVAGWHLILSDESAEIMSGIINGSDEKRLEKAGYIPQSY